MIFCSRRMALTLTLAVIVAPGQHASAKSPDLPAASKIEFRELSAEVLIYHEAEEIVERSSSHSILPDSPAALAACSVNEAISLMEIVLRSVHSSHNDVNE